MVGNHVFPTSNRTKTTGDLALHAHRSEVTLGLIAAKGYPFFVEEASRLVPALLTSQREVAPQGLPHPSPLLHNRLSCGGEDHPRFRKGINANQECGSLRLTRDLDLALVVDRPECGARFSCPAVVHPLAGESVRAEGQLPCPSGPRPFGERCSPGRDHADRRTAARRAR